ncbi:hypothetical protein SLE2022_117140 [Rubroshorea leprosula]
MDVVSSKHLQAQLLSKFDKQIPFRKPHYRQPHHLQSCFSLAKRYESLAWTHQVLDEIPISDTFAWNNLIQTHLTSNDPLAVLSIYHQMLLHGVRPDKHTLPRVLTASRLSANFPFGKQVHAHTFKLGFSSDLYVITSLIEMYGRLDSVDTARWLFESAPARNSIAWTMIAKLYLIDNKPDLAIDIFNQIVELGVDIDPVVLATAINACSLLKSLQQARKVHQIARKCGLECHVLVSNSLLKMYVECDNLEEAQAVFNAMPSKDIISWTEMIRAYRKTGGFNESLKLLRRMISSGVQPDSLTISSVLPACGRVQAHKQGKEIHAYLLRNGIAMNVKVQNALMDMYVKSGFIELASNVFAGMREQDIISWTIMILGYSLHGRGELGVDIFCKIKKDSSIEIDELTYAAVLHACSIARMVDKGRFFFNCIKKPKVTHCALMVSLLARAGLFNEARSFIEEYQIEKHVEVLRALLDGCRMHQQLKIGKQVIEQLCELEPLNAENYVLLSNWYAEIAKWDMVDKVRQMVRDMGLKPKRAYSWIEFQNKVHVFSTGDVSHPRSERIYWELQCLMKKMEDERHNCSSVFGLHDVDEERECLPTGHSEMLAISFGLISTQVWTTIRITKNLRVCQSCHDTAKVLSKMVEREIIIKDPNCFHHFKDGLCSCRDFW